MITKLKKLLQASTLPLLALVLVAPGVVLTAPASAAASKSQYYALYCDNGGSVVVHKTSVDCDPSHTALFNAGTNSSLTAKPKSGSGNEVTIVKMTCKTGTPNTAKGYIAQLTCSSKSSFTVVKGKVFPPTNGGGGGGAKSTCSNPNGCPDAAIKCTADDCDLIAKYVNPGIELLSAAFGIIAVISLILGGINYTTSGGDPQKTAQAKQRIFNTIFAVIAYLFLYAFLQFLIPGGAFR